MRGGIIDRCGLPYDQYTVWERLELSDTQRAELEKLQSEVDQRLAEILSADQLQKLRNASQ